MRCCPVEPAASPNHLRGIGNSPGELERNLDEFCGLARKWRCVLLLDEADVFLPKRGKGDVDSNARVGVFLRVLEYYSGVLILTSNWVGEIDEAFWSRIHICLFYPKLDKSSAARVWEKSMARVKISEMKIGIEEDQIRHFYEVLWLENEKYPTRQWNGRQIKNAFQTAIAMVHWEFNTLQEKSRPPRPVLRARHFKRVGQTSAHFDDYIGSVYGIEEQDAYSVLAAREEVRKDNVPLTSFMNSKDDRSLYGVWEKKSPFQRALPRSLGPFTTEAGGFKLFQGGGFNDEDDDDDGEDKELDKMDENEEDDHVDEMEYLREIAKLKKKYKKSSR